MINLTDLINSLSLQTQNKTQGVKEQLDRTFDELLNEKNMGDKTDNLMMPDTFKENTDLNMLADEQQDIEDLQQEEELQYILSQDEVHAISEEKYAQSDSNLNQLESTEQYLNQKTANEKVLPLTAFALGSLSFKNEFNTSLVGNIASNTTSESNQKVTHSYSATYPAPGKSLPNESKVTQPTNQQFASGNVKTNSKVNFELNESQEALLYKSSLSNQKIMAKNFNFIEAKDHNILLLRDYRLSQQQEEQLAKTAQEFLNTQESINKQTKVIINGTTYRKVK
ncbi:hypothetical protein [Kangiella sp. HZ709]|uniref:hypothetical protein n=1 Tax=Kangiella sp. HZ709 TaxID=2666328 RepID=UPI0012B151CC|nr:hypothetical protein [Kangiella sp. HZ709]MRX26846.1 hypothetical protein [Kangiella sp. HZ709]